MKILTLNIKREPFDAILRGTKTAERRVLSPASDGKIVNYINSETGEKYNHLHEMPIDCDVDINVIHYDALKLCTGAYKGQRPYIVVKVKSVEMQYLTDDRDEHIYYVGGDGNEYLAMAVVYNLGEIVEKFNV